MLKIFLKNVGVLYEQELIELILRDDSVQIREYLWEHPEKIGALNYFFIAAFLRQIEVMGALINPMTMIESLTVAVTPSQSWTWKNDRMTDAEYKKILDCLSENMMQEDPSVRVQWDDFSPVITLVKNEQAMPFKDDDFQPLESPIQLGDFLKKWDHQGKSLLHDLAGIGHLVLLNYLIDECKMPVDLADAFGKTPLMYAAESGQIEGVKFLLSKGAHPLLQDEKENIAENFSDVPEIKELLIFEKKKLQKQFIKAVSDNDLFRVSECFNGRFHAASWLSSLGSKNSPGLFNSFSKNTPLRIAVTSGLTKMIERLVSHGADPNERNATDWSLLMHAAYHLSIPPEVARTLIECGADVNAVCSKGWTALILAAEKGRLDLLKILCDHHADLGHRDSDGKSAFDYAKANGHHLACLYLELKEQIPKCFSHFFNPGAQLPHSDPKNTPLRIAVKARLSGVIKQLVSYGADPNECYAVGWSLLMHAAYHASIPLEIARTLIECGADVNAVCSKGWTALIVAAEKGRLDLVELFLAYQANAEHRDSSGQSALDYACASENYLVVFCLMNHLRENGSQPDLKTLPLVMRMKYESHGAWDGYQRNARQCSDYQDAKEDPIEALKEVKPRDQIYPLYQRVQETTEGRREESFKSNESKGNAAYVPGHLGKSNRRPRSHRF